MCGFSTGKNSVSAAKDDIYFVKAGVVPWSIK
jgi:hypothetical protein